MLSERAKSQADPRDGTQKRLLFVFQAGERLRSTPSDTMSVSLERR